MSRRFHFLFSLLLITATSTAQRFSHGAGTGYAAIANKNSHTTGYISLLYSPRIMLRELQNSSFSIGVPITFGAGGSYSHSSSLGTNNQLQYTIYAPVLFNYNFGAGASTLTSKRIGYFFGAGIGLSHGNFRQTYWQQDDTGWGYFATNSTIYTQLGPTANAGVRFGVGQQSKNIELLLSYLRAVSANRHQFFGISAAFNFN